MTQPDRHLMFLNGDIREKVVEVEEALKGGFRSLRFPPRLEASFLDYFFDKTLKRLRIAILVGVILYALFGIDDRLLLPNFYSKLWLIRFGIVCPIGLFTFAFTFSRYFRKFMQPAVWVAMQVGGLGIIAMIALNPTEVGHYHTVGLILVIMYTFTLVGLRFWYGISWAISVLIAYLCVALPSAVPPAVIVHDVFNIFAAANIGAISSYILERYMRKDFLKSLLLHAEKQELQEAGIKLQELSTIDELTQMANRRQFEVFFHQEWQRALRNQSEISVILFDIDFFKAYNDGYGHQAGDECLRQVAHQIKNCANRAGDLAARYGGEEFIVVLPETDTRSAMAMAERCRAKIQSASMPHGFSPIRGVVTLSAGTATVVPSLEMDKKKVIEAADQALYRAKNEGRNRVMGGRCNELPRNTQLNERVKIASISSGDL